MVQFALVVFGFALTIIASPASLTAASAQDYPNKVIKLIVGYPPGGFPDTMARLFGDQMAKLLNQTVVVENKPSAGAVIAGETVAKAAPDGYTLLVSDVQIWAIDPLIYKSLPFDPYKDLVPVSILGTTPLFLVVSSKLGVANFKELSALLKANPGKYNYSTAGIGSLHHFATEMLKAKAGFEITHVPYKGSTQILPALASGEVALGFQALSQLPTFVQQGTVNVVAVATAKRSSAMPNIPTFSELGVDEIDFPGSMGILAPKGTPSVIVDKVSAAIRAATKSPELAEKLAKLGIDAVGSTPSETAAWIKRDAEQYAKAAEFAGIKPDLNAN
jgi:tripartite-type tricarboxylate transporter receptor subunit TctC